MKDTVGHGSVTVYGVDALRKLSVSLEYNQSGYQELTLPEGLWRREVVMEVDRLPDSPGQRLHRALRLARGDDPGTVALTWARLEESVRADHELAAKHYEEGK